MTTDKTSAETAPERAAEAAQELKDAATKLRTAIKERTVPREAGLRLVATIEAVAAKLRVDEHGEACAENMADGSSDALRVVLLS
ncbi:hypothetical protein [Amycolatopsis samaneae]|uniref:Uncharacterized protein n=1 Tax=Amycolatopsis samaneae TaxID=664691 RepID=A0ABW5GKJ4_9PSEU